MIPNTKSVPDFNSLQHGPRKCKLLQSELVAAYSPAGIQFSVLADSFKSLKAAPWVSALEAFTRSREGKAGCLTKNSAPNVHEPQSLRKSEGSFLVEDTHCNRLKAKKDQLDVSPAASISAPQKVLWTNTQSKYNTWLIIMTHIKKLLV